MPDIKRNLKWSIRQHQQEKHRISAKRWVSVTLGLMVAYALWTIISIEIKGRQGLTTPTKWAELIKTHPYERKTTDARSPCPMLNTLANHGFIARDGRHIKSDDLFDALMLMGAPPTVTAGFLAYAFSAYKEVTPTDSFLSQFRSLESIDLDRLFVHNLVEHDVSLTRLDQGISNQTLPVPGLVKRMIQLAQYNNTNKDMFTRRNENDARRLRWMESMRDNPTFHLSLFHQFASGTECSLLLDILGREGQMLTKHLESFLLDEKFPEDWYPRDTAFGLWGTLTKPMVCWIGLHQSQVTLDLLNHL